MTTIVLEVVVVCPGPVCGSLGEGWDRGLVSEQGEVNDGGAEVLRSPLNCAHNILMSDLMHNSHSPNKRISPLSCPRELRDTQRYFLKSDFLTPKI